MGSGISTDMGEGPFDQATLQKKFGDKFAQDVFDANAQDGKITLEVLQKYLETTNTDSPIAEETETEKEPQKITVIKCDHSKPYSKQLSDILDRHSPEKLSDKW